jgi:hypothetical protein
MLKIVWRKFEMIKTVSNVEDKTMEKKTSLVKYFWQITYAHTIAYFIAGIFAVAFLNYRELFELEIFSGQVRSLDDPMVALGPGLQIFRGIILALILLPLRKTFFDEKHGLLKLGLLVLGLSVISTYSGGMGSFDGFIYNTLPIRYQINGYPEAIIWILLFIGILAVSKKYEHKKIITVLSIVFIVLICLSSIMGFVMV